MTIRACLCGVNYAHDTLYELCVSSGGCDKCQYEGHFYKVSPIMKVCHNGSILLASKMILAGFIFHWGSKMDGVIVLFVLAVRVFT